MYIAYNKQENRLEALQGHHVFPAVCQCRRDNEDYSPKVQSDYGKINSGTELCMGREMLPRLCTIYKLHAMPCYPVTN